MSPVWEGKISLLVPVYNMAEPLPACLNSVWAQNDPDIELILVDDGSTDGSGALCDTFARERPGRVKVLHQENAGPLLARWRGLKLAAGEVCMFLDADDMLAPGSLAEIRAIFGGTGADMVIFNYDNLYEPTGERETDETIFPDGSVFEGEGKRAVYEELIRSWRLNNLCMKAVKAPLVQEDDTPYEDYAHLRFGEDLLQSLYPLTRARRIAYCAKPLYIYRHARASAIGGAKGNTGAGGAALEKLREYMRLWGMDTPDMREILALRRLNQWLANFWQAYRAAKTPGARRLAIRGRQRARPAREELSYLASPALGWKKRAQLRAALAGNRPLLWLMERLGGRRIRRQYGE